VFWGGGNGAHLWTSGTNDGIACLRKHGWCPSGQLIPKQLIFAAGELHDMASENGLTISISGNPATSYMRDYLEGWKNWFMCEVGS
jgi:hypothetical protein